MIPPSSSTALQTIYKPIYNQRCPHAHKKSAQTTSKDKKNISRITGTDGGVLTLALYPAHPHQTDTPCHNKHNHNHPPKSSPPSQSPATLSLPCHQVVTTTTSWEISPRPLPEGRVRCWGPEWVLNRRRVKSLWFVRLRQISLGCGRKGRGRKGYLCRSVCRLLRRLWTFHLVGWFQRPFALNGRECCAGVDREQIFKKNWAQNLQRTRQRPERSENRP